MYVFRRRFDYASRRMLPTILVPTAASTPFDTREKRACILGVGRPWMRDKLPGTIDEGWRLATGNVYCGNALTPPVGGFQAAWAVNANTLLGGGIT